jgi:hypothetical protein
MVKFFDPVRGKPCRLGHRCATLEFEGKSYRLKEAAARIAATPE